MLVLSKTFDPELDAKENLVRFAEQNACHVEIVNKSSALDKLSGVGCLLRYRLPPNETPEHTS